MDETPSRADSASASSRMDVLPATPRAAHAPGDETIGRAIARAREGDLDALHFLYVRHADDVHGLVSGLVHDPVAAERITQEVFCTVGSAILRYEQRESSFASWLLRIARRTAVHHLSGGVEEVTQIDA